MSRESYLEVRIPQPGGTDTQFIEADLYYSLGGANYFSGEYDTRGLYVSFCPIERVPSDTDPRFATTRVIIGDRRGRRFLVKELKRKSKKAGEEAAEKFRTIEKDVMDAAAHQDWPKVRTLLGRLS